MHNNAWINATTGSIADAVFEKTGLRCSHTNIKNIMRRRAFSLQKNQKYDQVGKAHPMRDTQFCHISAKRDEYILSGDPVISIDTKAKEKLGDFIRSGAEYRRKRDPSGYWIMILRFRTTRYIRRETKIFLKTCSKRKR